MLRPPMIDVVLLGGRVFAARGLGKRRVRAPGVMSVLGARQRHFTDCDSQIHAFAIASQRQ